MFSNIYDEILENVYEKSSYPELFLQSVSLNLLEMLLIRCRVIIRMDSWKTLLEKIILANFASLLLWIDVQILFNIFTISWKQLHENVIILWRNEFSFLVSFIVSSRFLSRPSSHINGPLMTDCGDDQENKKLSCSIFVKGYKNKIPLRRRIFQ